MVLGLMKHMGGSSNLQISDGLYTQKSYDTAGTNPVYNTNYVISPGGVDRNVIAFPRYAVFGMWVKFNPLVDHWMWKTDVVSNDVSPVNGVNSFIEFDPTPSPATITVDFFNEGAGNPNSRVTHTWNTLNIYGSVETLLDHLQDGWNHIGLEHNRQFVAGAGFSDNNDKMTLYINGKSMGMKTESGATQQHNQAHFGKEWTFRAEEGKVCFQQPVIYQASAGPGTEDGGPNTVDFDFSDIVGGATSGTPTFVDLGRDGTSGGSRTLPTPIIYEIFKHPFNDLRQTNATLTLGNSALLHDCKTQNP